MIMQRTYCENVVKHVKVIKAILKFFMAEIHAPPCAISKGKPELAKSSNLSIGFVYRIVTRVEYSVDL